MGPRARLAVLVAGLAVLYVLVGPLRIVPLDDVQIAVAAAGPLAPVAFVVASALLGAALVPGALLAGLAGVLFGPWLGAAASVGAATLSAALAFTLSRRVGREGAAQVAPARAQVVGRWLERHGLAAVVIARLAPSVPDAPMTYAMGLTSLRLPIVVLGTAIGAAPRAFAYAALGSELDDLSSPLALAALGVLVLTGLAGAGLAARHAKVLARARQIAGRKGSVKGQRGRADD